MTEYQFFVAADERIEKEVCGKKVTFRPVGVKDYTKYISKIRRFGQSLSDGTDISDELYESICELLARIVIHIEGNETKITKELFYGVTLQAFSDLLVSLSELITISDKEKSFR